MYKTRLKEPVHGARSQPGYAEMDPSRRYGRLVDVLGRGATKTVYKAFDEVLGMEVAWNQVKLNDVFRSPDELQRLYCEVHLLKSLNHDSIIKFYAHWIDCERRTFNFITEMLTSGTLREYIQRYKRVNIHAVKNWARQILHGLVYLHGHNPPVIHRDIKCDNIFVNGHLGQVKIGDLGLAAILKGSHHAHSVIGTPEFMAPELYEEDYDELVDIYSFGMCMIEMLTSEYPYSECSNPAQIYKKVTSGKLPEAIQRIEDVEARNFVKKCLQNVEKRPSAQELLEDPFLDIDDLESPPAFLNKSCSSPKGDIQDVPDILEQPKLRSTDMTITGTMDPTDDTIFLKVKISHKDGQARNVYFPFDITSDTAVDVATEMVKELEICEFEPFDIADMINDEISALVPSWKHENLLENRYSFNYNDDHDDDDENTIQRPLSPPPSHSSSQASLPGLCILPYPELYTSNNGMTSLSDWFQDNVLINEDDTSSQTSPSSHNYSSFNFCSANENYFDLGPKTCKQSDIIAGNQNSTRFCPKEMESKKINRQQCSLLGTNQIYGSRDNKKLGRVKSQVDIRSQLLHRSLVEEVHKRRMFKTVGAVENIGFKEF